MADSLQRQQLVNQHETMHLEEILIKELKLDRREITRPEVPRTDASAAMTESKNTAAGGEGDTDGIRREDVPPNIVQPESHSEAVGHDDDTAAIDHVGDAGAADPDYGVNAASVATDGNHVRPKARLDTAGREAHTNEARPEKLDPVPSLQAGTNPSPRKVTKTATHKQRAANRKNAKRSTGPRSGAGKARSAMNSTRHGLCGQFHLISGENPQEFSKFKEEARAGLKPQGAVEESYCDRWTKDTWLLNRLDNVQSALLLKEESLDDMSLDDIFSYLESLHVLSGRAFDEIQKIEKLMHYPRARSDGNGPAMDQNKRDAGPISDADLAQIERGTELEALKTLFVKQLIPRASKMSSAPNKAWSAQTPAKIDRGQGESDGPSADEVINRMARAFSRNRESVALALRYRAKIERSRDNALHELQRFQAARHGQVVAVPEMVDVTVNFTGKEENRN